MSAPVELELKLALHPADANPLRRHPLLSEEHATAPIRKRLLNTYFDTPDFALRERRMALRLRRSGRQWLQTLKGGGGATGGLHQRDEWEMPVAGAMLDLPRLADTPAGPWLLKPKIADRLQPVFTTHFERTAWVVADEHGNQLEVALDRGSIVAADRREPICELELELISGNPAFLFEVAAAFMQVARLKPDHRSKAERGYALFAGTPAKPVKAVAAVLKPDQTPAAGLRAIVAACLEQAMANATGAAAGTDPEYVHQMRVALRRMRTAFRLLRSAVGHDYPDELVNELRWLAGTLGQARDWDVMATETLPPIVQAAIDPNAARRLNATANLQRANGRRAVAAALTSPRYRQLLLDLTRWLALPAPAVLPDTPPEGAPEAITAAKVTPAKPLPATLKAAAVHLLGKQLQRLSRETKPFSELAPEVRHQIRIEGKRLRYAVEFFGQLFKDQAVRRFLQPLVALQQTLGDLNDIATTTRLLADIKLSPTGRAFIDGWLASRAAERLAVAQAQLDAVKAAKRFWKK